MKNRNPCEKGYFQTLKEGNKELFFFNSVSKLCGGCIPHWQVICISSSASLSNTILTIWDIWSYHSGCVFASLSLVFSFLFSLLFFFLQNWVNAYVDHFTWDLFGLGCLNRGRQIWESIFLEWETVHARIWESSAIGLVTIKSWHGPSIGFSLA